MLLSSSSTTSHQGLMIWLLSLLDLFVESNASGNVGVEDFINEGTRLLASGQIAEALLKYNLAIDYDDSNYLSYFRRATVYLAMGKSRSAFDDLDKTLELNKDFHAARSKRVDFYYKNGEFTKANADLQYMIDAQHNVEANQQLRNELIQLSQVMDEAQALYQSKRYTEALNYLNVIIEKMPYFQKPRELRANCYLKLGDKQKAIYDFRHSVKQTNDNTEGILHLSLLMYEVGDAKLSLDEIRECLRLDPDHKECFKHYKMIKQLAKQLDIIESSSEDGAYEECVAKAKKILKQHGHHSSYAELMNLRLCHCQIHTNPSDAVQVCSKLIAMDPTNDDYHCDRAEAYLNMEKYDEAIQDYQNVLGRDQHHSRAKKGIQRAQKLLKLSQRRDYYKILGVPRTATKQQILKTYRKLAAELHPDHYKGADKKEAEKRFIDISAAKEVLSDAKMRQQFDNGDDPLDPEFQEQGPGGPFGGFTFTNFNPFEGGNFEFHFG